MAAKTPPYETPLRESDLDRARLHAPFPRSAFVAIGAWVAWFALILSPLTGVHCGGGDATQCTPLVNDLLLPATSVFGIASLAGLALRRSWAGITSSAGAATGLWMGILVIGDAPPLVAGEAAIFALAVVGSLMTAAHNRGILTLAGDEPADPPPAESLRPLGALVRRRIALAVALLLAGGIAIAIVKSNERNARRFEATAPQTTATVVDGGDPLRVRYRHPVSGRIVEAEIPNLLEVYERGERVRIRYDAGDPGRVGVVAEPYDAESPLILFGFLPLAGTGALAASAWWVRRLHMIAGRPGRRVRTRIDATEIDAGEQDPPSGIVVVTVFPVDGTEPVATFETLPGGIPSDLPYDGPAEARGIIGWHAPLVVRVGDLWLWPRRRVRVGRALARLLSKVEETLQHERDAKAAAEAANEIRPVEAAPDPGWHPVRLFRRRSHLTLLESMRKQTLVSVIVNAGLAQWGGVMMLTGRPSRVAGIVAVVAGLAWADPADATPAELYRLIDFRSTIAGFVSSVPAAAVALTFFFFGAGPEALAIAGPAGLLCDALVAPTRSWLARIQEALDEQGFPLSVAAVVSAPAVEIRRWRQPRE
ncbi:MAG TPA: DUF3592 domain-containing protein [Actinomycetota bacterium]|nr:DUF3592 domain-containing protein [Actinomycetota bacterium]